VLKEKLWHLDLDKEKIKVVNQEKELKFETYKNKKKSLRQLTIIFTLSDA